MRHSRRPGSGPTGPACFIEQLTQSTDGDLLPGLDVVKKEQSTGTGFTEALEVSPAAVTCCSGTGIFVDAKMNIAQRCELTRRQSLVAAIVAQYRVAWKEQFGSIPPRYVPDGHWPDIHKRLAPLVRQGPAATHATTPGLIDIHDPRPLPRPHWFWAAALASAWRFGLPTAVVSFGHTASESAWRHLLPHPPKVIFIEHIDRLWMPDRAYAFESLISYADLHGSQLWCDLMWRRKTTDESAGSGEAKPLAQAFRDRMAKHHLRDPLSFLSPDSHSKLMSMCARSRSATQKSKSNAIAPGRSKSESPF